MDGGSRKLIVCPGGGFCSGVLSGSTPGGRETIVTGVEDWVGLLAYQGHGKRENK